MIFTPQLVNELNLLGQFELGEPTTGLKVHSTASPDTIAAAKRLHEKGLTTLVDGGYLTPRGTEAARHAHAVLRVLGFSKEG